MTSQYIGRSFGPSYSLQPSCLSSYGMCLVYCTEVSARWRVNAVVISQSLILVDVFACSHDS